MFIKLTFFVWFYCFFYTFILLLTCKDEFLRLILLKFDKDLLKFGDFCDFGLIKFFGLFGLIVVWFRLILFFGLFGVFGLCGYLKLLLLIL
jgi:hypothetical protein